MPRNQQALNWIKIGDTHLRSGDLTRAIEAFETGLGIDPCQPDAWFNLAWTQRAARQFEAALGSYAQAIAYGDPHPEQALLNRAAILSDHLFQPAAAIAELEQALRANRDFLPALLNLGNLQEDLGDRAAARHAYGEVLLRAPHSARAHARIAAIDVTSGKAHDVVDRLKAVLPEAEDVADRAELLFALGNALDATGETVDAFQAIEAANWITRSLASSRYDPTAQERLVDALISAFPAHPHSYSYFSAQPGGAARSTRTPVFICGMFRSGSTLAERILDQHAVITGGGELEAIPAIAQALSPYPALVPTLTDDRIDALRAQYLAELPGEGLVTDKRCDNFLHIGLIKTLFPSARIVHTRRNVLDTLLSTYFLQFGDGVTYGSDLHEAVHYYLQYARLMAHWERCYGADIVDLDYDALVVDPRAVLSTVLAALDLPWDERCLADPAVPQAVRTASAWQVRRPIHRGSLHRWQRYRTQLAPAIAMLERHGITP